MVNRHQPTYVEIGKGVSVLVGLPTIASWISNTRPQSPKTGTLGYNPETNSLEFWDGASWYTVQLRETKLSGTSSS